MKSNSWLFGGLAWLAAASILAQDSTREAKPAVPRRPVTGALANDLVLEPPAAATVQQDSLNVRSKPVFSGDIITHVHKGQSVTVLEQISLAKPGPNEPTNWSRIALPTNAQVWVFAKYIDTNSMTVSARRLNVRSRPDDARDSIAILEKGAPVKEVRRIPDWIQIEPPTNAFGWVASDFLTMQPATAPPPPSVAAVEPPVALAVVTPPAIPPAAAPIAPPPATPPVAEPVTPPPATPPVAAAVPPEQPVAPPVANWTLESAASPPATPAATNIVAPEPVATTPPAAQAVSTPPQTTIKPLPSEKPAKPVAPEKSVKSKQSKTPASPAPALVPLQAAPTPFFETSGTNAKPRIVAREGLLRRSINVQAPADYELLDISSGQLIEYVKPDPKDGGFRVYTGHRVAVTGPEWLDRRWPKSPILQVQTIDFMP
jgi:uncharacterized protein YgiM (DUF1202 family)